MTATPLLERRLLFVTGKGGVGKTSIAAGLATVAASQGRSVLLCEVDAKGGVAAAFESAPLGFVPREVAPGVHAMVMDTEESLREYLRLHLRIPVVSRLGPLARSFDFVASAAPGVSELLTIGKLAYEVREQHYDLVVVDAAASGHVVGQLAAPAAIAGLVQVGKVADQTDWMLDILHDPQVTGTVIVAVPEEMSIAETVELGDRLGAQTEVDLAAVIVNRVLPELFGAGESAVFDRLSVGEPRRRLVEAVGGSVDLLFDGAALAVALRRAQASQIARLRDDLARVPLVFVPEMFTRAQGLRSTRMIAEALGDELT